MYGPPMERIRVALAVSSAIGLVGGTGIGPVRATTPDGRVVEIVLDGSVQNPAFSPDGTQLLVTVWRGGYNVGPADLVVIPLDGGEPWELVADGWDNVNLPGSFGTQHPTRSCTPRPRIPTTRSGWSTTPVATSRGDSPSMRTKWRTSRHGRRMVTKWSSRYTRSMSKGRGGSPAPRPAGPTSRIRRPRYS